MVNLSGDALSRSDQLGGDEGLVQALVEAEVERPVEAALAADQDQPLAQDQEQQLDLVDLHPI